MFHFREVNTMKTILIILLIGSASYLIAAIPQDSTKNRNTEKEQIENQEKNQQKNQSDDNQIKDRNINGDNIQSSDNKDGKGKKDVFIDKDGDGIADTRASGMSFQKMRKRTRQGQQGGSGQGGNGGSGGNGGGK